MNRLKTAFRTGDTNIRLQAALAAGTDPSPQDVLTLMDQCATEPDFFVRDMLTWALARHPAETTVPLLLEELHSEIPQARSQAMHTCSKIAAAEPKWAPTIWSTLTEGAGSDNLLTAMVADTDDEVARAAWRTAVGIVPTAEASDLARLLSTQLGRGDRELRRSLSRALVVLGSAAEGVLGQLTHTHARATLLLLQDPELSFDAAEYEAEHDAAR